MYNSSKNNASTQVSLIVKVPLYGKRSAKNTFYLRGRRLNVSCWIPNNLSICKITATEMVLPAVFTSFPPKHLLSLVGLTFVPFLLHDCRYRTFRSSDFYEVQRIDSRVDWTTAITRNESYAGLHFKHDFRRSVTNRKSTRHNQTKDVSISQHINFCHSGLRFKCAYSIWESGTCRSWLQSFQTWQKIISSAIWLRESSFNQFSRTASSRQTERQRSSHSSNTSSVGKDTFYYRCFKNTSQGGCRFLLLADNQVFRRKQLWFCNSSTTDQPDKTTASQSAVSYIQPSIQVSDSGVSLSTTWLGKRTSFYSYAVSTTPRTGSQPEDALKDRQLRVPCICNESGLEPGTCVVFLQRSCCDRNKYQRTEIRFLYEQNTNQKVSCKSGTFKTIVTGLRFVPLVSDIMFTGTNAIKNTEVDSSQYSCSFRKIHNTGAQEYTEIPEISSKREIAESDISKSLESKIFTKIGQFANTLNKGSVEPISKNAVFPHFIG